MGTYEPATVTDIGVTVYPVAVALILDDPAATPAIVISQLADELLSEHDAGLTVAIAVLLEAIVTLADPPPVKVRVTRREIVGVIETLVVLNEREGFDEDPEPPQEETNPITAKHINTLMIVFMTKTTIKPVCNSKLYFPLTAIKNILFDNNL